MNVSKPTSRLRERPLYAPARVSKRALEALLGRDLFFFPDIRLPKTRIGTAHGWTLTERVSKPLNNLILYSVGLGCDISFDLGIIDKYGCQVYGFDPTPISLAWLEKQTLPKQFHLFKIGMSSFDGKQSFMFPDNPDWDDFSIARKSGQKIELDVLSFNSMMKMLNHSYVDILKLDVEGAEYSIVEDICRGSAFPGQLLVEFHHRLHEISIEQTKKAVCMLRDCGYKIFNITPAGREFSFVHKSIL